jgi:hypothetical protein
MTELARLLLLLVLAGAAFTAVISGAVWGRRWRRS